MPPENASTMVASEEPADASVSWSVEAVGLAWWVVLPLAAIVGYLLWRLAADELRRLARRPRRLLLGLRTTAAVVLVLLLLEPTCMRKATWQEEPEIAVLIDDSASAAVTDSDMRAELQLDEMALLGLFDAEGRSLAGRKTVALLQEIIDELPAVQTGLRILEHPVGESREQEERRERLEERAEDLAERMEPLARGLKGVEDLGDPLEELTAKLRELAELCAADTERLLGGGRRRVEAQGRYWRDIRSRLQALKRHARVAQQSTDEALVAADGEELTAALERFHDMSRYERANRFVLDHVLERFGTTRCRITGIGPGRRRIDPAEALVAGETVNAELGLETDYARPLHRLARQRDEANLGAVLIVGDGRTNAGGSAAASLRSLAARGIRVGAMVLGDPRQPRDAVVGEIVGSTEVFKDEQVRLDVRFRITGFPDRRWNLVLRRDGEEVGRKQVRGTGDWQSERFEFDAERPGLRQIVAHLEPVAEEAEVRVPENRGILREAWTNVDGSSLDHFRRQVLGKGKTPDTTEVLPAAQAPQDWGDQYGQRLRGWLIPPQTGSYRFWITSDDASELWLGTNADPETATVIARVADYVGAGEWKAEKGQRSQPVKLRAGEPYYLETLHKEGTGADHVAVRWQRPDAEIESPIPGEHLRPWSAAGLQPDEGTDEEGEKRPEELSLDNNQAQLAIRVSEDPLRILLLDDKPRWEMRYLATLLERDRRHRLVRRYASVRLPRKEHEFLPVEQDELDAFDMVVLGDVPSKLNLLDAEAQQRLVDFVSLRGGFLVVIAGRQAMPLDYALGPLAELLPVKLGPEPPRDRVERRGLRLAARGKEDPITAVLEDDDLNQRLWQLLPPLDWINRQALAKPNARTLVESDDALGTPVVVTSRYGGGRVLYLGSDETWRWRERLGERIHQTFWLQALRWGLGLRLRGGDPRLQVSIEHAMLEPDEATEVRARATDKQGRPIARGLTVHCQPLDREGEDRPGGHRELDMLPIADSRGMVHQVLSDLEEGRWRIEVRGGHPDLKGLVERRELIVRPRRSLESLDLSANRPGLESFLAAGSTLVVGPDDPEALLDHLAAEAEPRERRSLSTFALWDGYWVVVLIVGLLLGEWLLRKRNGLP